MIFGWIAVASPEEEEEEGALLLRAAFFPLPADFPFVEATRGGLLSKFNRNSR